MGAAAGEEFPEPEVEFGAPLQVGAAAGEEFPEPELPAPAAPENEPPADNPFFNAFDAPTSFDAPPAAAAAAAPDPFAGAVRHRAERSNLA